MLRGGVIRHTAYYAIIIDNNRLVEEKNILNNAEKKHENYWKT